MAFPRSPRMMNIVVFISCTDEKRGLQQAQFMIRQLCDRDHSVTLFDCSHEIPVPIYEEPEDTLAISHKQPMEYLEYKVVKADAILLITDSNRSGYDIPDSLAGLSSHFNGNAYVWNPSGIKCILLGGSISSRQAAIQLRMILDGTDYPSMANALPRRCSQINLYTIDYSLETPGPCVL